MADETEAGVIARLAQQGTTPEIQTTEERREFLIHHEDMTRVEVTDPNRLRVARGYVLADETLQTKDSLVDYIDRFKTSKTMLFANVSANAITARITYHSPSDGETAAGPNFDAHRATLMLPYSQEWKDWSGIDGRFMSQKDFARWIEEHPGDIVAPDAADLREITRDLAALRKVNFTEAVRTNSNAESFSYRQENEVHRDGEVIEIPSQFQLGIPVYFGEPTTSLMAYLRWDIAENGQLTLGVKLSRAEYVRQAVFKAIATDIAGRTKTPLVYATT